MEEINQLKQRLDLAEARLIGLTIAVSQLLLDASPQARSGLRLALMKTADYAHSKSMNNRQIECLLELTHQICRDGDD